MMVDLRFRRGGNVARLLSILVGVSFLIASSQSFVIVRSSRNSLVLSSQTKERNNGLWMGRKKGLGEAVDISLFNMVERDDGVDHKDETSSEEPSLFSYEFRERRCSTSKGTSATEKQLVDKEEKARQIRIGQMKQRLRRAVRREDRITCLELKLKKAAAEIDSESEYITESERAELKGLIKVRDSFVEQYDPLTFTNEHKEFKNMHNHAFIQLSRYCEREHQRLNKEGISLSAKDSTTKPINLFFLDGPDGGTSSALINSGDFDPSQCFVANRHESSCKSLRISGGGLLPDENVVNATAAESLTISTPFFLEGEKGTCAEEPISDTALHSTDDGAFAHIDFVAYYFDGCGGFVPHVVGMISAALLRDSFKSSGPIAVGYSLLGGNKNIVAKELAVSRALTVIARRRGMRMIQVLDDPVRFGLSPDIQKIGGSSDGTFTTWVILEADPEV